MHHLIREFHSTPWAVLPGTLAMMQAILGRWASGVKLSDAEIAAAIGQAPAEAAARRNREQSAGGGSIAVLPVFGLISHRATMVSDVSTGINTSTETLGQRIKDAVNDQAIGAIVLDIDSPGGSVYGVAELADQIYAARESKPVIASVNSLSASAAYWIASAASEIVITPGGEAGSIGVYAAHKDMSAQLEQAGVKVTLISAGQYKTEGNPFEPLSDEAREAIQASVNQYYNAFTAGVARNRGVKHNAVLTGYGQGRTLGAEQAIREGLADRIGTFADVIDGLRSNTKRQSMANTRKRLELASR